MNLKLYYLVSVLSLKHGKNDVGCKVKIKNDEELEVLFVRFAHFIICYNICLLSKKFNYVVPTLFRWIYFDFDDYFLSPATFYLDLVAYRFPFTSVPR